VAESVADAGKLTDVRVELDAVLVPHRKLPLGEPAGGAALRRIPGPAGPDLVGVAEIQLAFELSAGELMQITNKIPVDVVGW
jgi:hypothetical protein